MRYREPQRMQAVSPRIGRPFGNPDVLLTTRAINTVANQRVADRRHVHSDLMRATRLGPAQNMREAIELLEFHLEIELGTNVKKWTQVVDAYIARQKKEEQAAKANEN